MIIDDTAVDDKKLGLRRYQVHVTPDVGKPQYF